jgi:hypothetical protein
MFLFYIATGVASMVLFGQATSGAQGTAATLASIARHATTVRLTVVLGLLTFMDAVVLAVALYALTRDQDRDLAMLALCCRVGEGVIGAISAVSTLGLLSVAMASTAAAGPDAAAVHALGDLLLKAGGGYTLVGATCFAVGSTLYSYLFLRARNIPGVLAWLGVLASVLLVAGLPLQLAGFLSGPATNFMWIPMAVFEVTFALWLLIKGVATTPKRISPELGDVTA